MTDISSRAHLTGVIILARFLELPLSRYEVRVEKTEGSPVFRRHWPGIISTNPFPRSYVLGLAKGLTSSAIGQFRKDEEGFCVSYRHPGLAREYLFSEGKVRCWRKNQALLAGDEADLQALRRQLRLINTRNRLTHLILAGIARHQMAYLASGDRLDLKPLSQVALAEWIRGEAADGSCFLPSGSGLELVDSSMISRLTRHMSVLSPQGREIPLRDFFPSARDLHKQMIAAILDEEKGQIRQGGLEKAYTDAEIKERLQERFGVSISRRTVSACRQGMWIRSSYTRNSNQTYPPRLAHFSSEYPLTMPSVKVNAPEVPGVYEISLADGEIEYPLGFSGVVYIGSTKSLRKRLGDHLRPGSKNGNLRHLFAHYPGVFRYIVEHGNPRAVEKVLCQCFVVVHGSLPRCNRIQA